MLAMQTHTKPHICIDAFVTKTALKNVGNVEFRVTVLTLNLFSVPSVHSD